MLTHACDKATKADPEVSVITRHEEGLRQYMNSQDQEMKTTVSVVIPVYNDKANLKKCLQSLFDTDSEDFEVLVVDDNSSDNPESITTYDACRIIRLEQNMGPAYARNVGVEQARGGIILFTDSDCVVMRNWVRNLSRELIRSHTQSRDVVAVCGRLDSGSGFFEKCHAYAGYAFVQGGQRRFMEFLNTSCVGLYKEAFWNVEGFSKDMRLCEDRDLAHKLIGRGYRIVFEPSVSIFHNHGVKSFRHFMATHRRWGLIVGMKYDLRHRSYVAAVRRLFSNRFTHFLLIAPTAFLSTLNIVRYNIGHDKRILTYAFFIFLAKIMFRWGIFIRSQAEGDE
jgi:glycosyltransferase involved in cell wall biosynthesis